MPLPLLSEDEEEEQMSASDLLLQVPLLQMSLLQVSLLQVSLLQLEPPLMLLCSIVSSTFALSAAVISEQLFPDVNGSCKASAQEVVQREELFSAALTLSRKSYCFVKSTYK